jgi:hypothetical protein
MTNTPSLNPRLYPVPTEEVPAGDYELTVAGKPVFTHAARVSAYPLNEFVPDRQRPLEQTEIASFAAWDMADRVDIEALCKRHVDSVVVRPHSAGIAPSVDGNRISFPVDRPGQYTVEVNGSHHALHLFANPPEKDAPDRADPQVLYFGPGVHCAGIIRMQSGQTLYLAAGAVVYGAVLAEHVTDLAIRGRGILDGSAFARAAVASLVTLHDCRNVRIEGITLRDSGGFTIAPAGCRDVHISNVKLIGHWRYNSDGIDLLNCRSCRVEDCFIRTFDDALCIKGWENFGTFVYRLRIPAGCGHREGRFMIDGEEGSFRELQRRFGSYPCPQDLSSDIQVRRCVIWCDWGRSLEVGAKTEVDEVRDLLFEDCDLIHVAHAALSVHSMDRALCRNIVYRDIRIEMDDEPQRPVVVQDKHISYKSAHDGYLPSLISVSNQAGYVSTDTTHGCIEDVSFENIDVTAPIMPTSTLAGHDAERPVRRVAIDNLRLNGRPITDAEDANIKMNAFVEDVELQNTKEIP